MIALIIAEFRRCSRCTRKWRHSRSTRRCSRKGRLGGMRGWIGARWRRQLRRQRHFFLFFFILFFFVFGFWNLLARTAARTGTTGALGRRRVEALRGMGGTFAAHALLRDAGCVIRKHNDRGRVADATKKVIVKVGLKKGCGLCDDRGFGVLGLGSKPRAT